MKYIILLICLFCASVDAREVSSALLEKVQVSGIPADGVSVGKKDDKSTWRIDFKPEATTEQREAAMQIVQDFDPSSVVAPKSELQKSQDDVSFLKWVIGFLVAYLFGPKAWDRLKAMTPGTTPDPDELKKE